MADGWAAMVLMAGTALLAGKGQWQRRRRRDHHARVAARRLQRAAVADLTHLEKRNRLLQDWAESRSDVVGPCDLRPLFGTDMIGDFHRVVIAELRIWAEEAAEELGRLRGRHLAERRAALRKLRLEIGVLCSEIEDREALWAGVADRPVPSASIDPDDPSLPKSGGSAPAPEPLQPAGQRY